MCGGISGGMLGSGGKSIKSGFRLVPESSDRSSDSARREDAIAGKRRR